MTARLRRPSVLLPALLGFLLATALPTAALAGAKHHRHRHHDHGFYHHEARGHDSWHRGHRFRHGRHHRAHAPRYYCARCHHGFHARRAFRHHLHHGHGIPLARLPFVLVHTWFGWVFYG